MRRPRSDHAWGEMCAVGIGLHEHEEERAVAGAKLDGELDQGHERNDDEHGDVDEVGAAGEERGQEKGGEACWAVSERNGAGHRGNLEGLAERRFGHVSFSGRGVRRRLREESLPLEAR